MKRLLSLLTAAILAVLSLGTAPEAVNAEEVIRVGFFAFDGYHNMDENGQKSGYGYEFIQNVLHYCNCTAEYVGYDKNWSQMQEMLENGEIDVLTSAQKTPEREAKFDFSETIGTSAAILTVKSGNQKYIAGEYSTYNGMRVGVIKGNSRNDSFEQYAASKGFTYTPVYYEDMNALTDDLQNEVNIDAIVTSNLRSTSNEWILDKFGASPFYAMVKKGNTELLNKINHAIEQMNSNSVGWQDELFSKYYGGDSGDSIALNSSERAYLQKLKDEGSTIKVLVNPDRAPYSYIENGELKGIIPDIFSELADRLQLPYEYISCNNRDEYQRIILSDEVDVVLDGRYDLSSAEDMGYKLTEQYIGISYVVVERAEHSGEVKSVAVLKESDTSEDNLDYFTQGRNVQEYDTMDECVNAVLKKKADACYLYEYCGQKYTIENIRGQLQATSLPDLKDELSFAVKADEDCILISILDKGITSVKNNYVDSAIKNNTDFSLGHLTLIQTMVRNPVIPITIVILLAGVIILIVYSHQKVRSERAELKKNLELEKTRQSLKEALEAANQASQSKGNFLSNMSHEIRTPLNAIIGYLSIAQDSDSDQQKVRYCIDNCDVASRHLLQIINDILDMSSIETGKLKIAHEEFDLKKEITDITAIFFQNARNKGIEFETHIDNLTNEWLVGDQLRLNQILMNLLSNAVKFTPEKGVVQLKIHQLREDDKKVYIQFAVTDTGIGMSQEYMSRIFKPFEQENAGTARKFGGSGLGLSITNNLIHMMGGTIKVASQQNEGTTFTVTLYFDKSTAKHEEQCANADYSHVRVLVVDDKEDECTYVKTMLRRCGVKSDYVTSGEAALKRIHSRIGGDYSYDLCIIDWNMPDMNGGEVTKRIRSELGRELPVIIATAYDISEFEEEAKAAGANKIVSKPLFQSTIFDLLVSTFGGYNPEADKSGDKTRVVMNGVHILLAEDNQMNMDIAVTMLEKAGIKVDKAYNGKEAYDMFTSCESGTYDLILMDVQMPVMDGYEATRQIRKSNHPEAETIPIIAMTANAFAEDVTEALSNGMNAHIAKPINYDKLFELLRKYSQKHAAKKDIIHG